MCLWFFKCFGWFFSFFTCLLGAVILLWILNRRLVGRFSVRSGIGRTVLAALASGATVGLLMYFGGQFSPVFSSLVAMLAGGLVALAFIRQELRLLTNL